MTTWPTKCSDFFRLPRRFSWTSSSLSGKRPFSPLPDSSRNGMTWIWMLMLQWTVIISDCMLTGDLASTWSVLPWSFISLLSSSLRYSIHVWITTSTKVVIRQKIIQMSIILVYEVSGSDSEVPMKRVVMTSIPKIWGCKTMHKFIL